MRVRPPDGHRRGIVGHAPNRAEESGGASVRRAVSRAIERFSDTDNDEDHARGCGCGDLASLLDLASRARDNVIDLDRPVNTAARPRAGSAHSWYGRHALRHERQTTRSGSRPQLLTADIDIHRHT